MPYSTSLDLNSLFIMLENPTSSTFNPANPAWSGFSFVVRRFERGSSGTGSTLDEIAKTENMTPSYATRLFRLTLLAPDILSAILSGQHRLN